MTTCAHCHRSISEAELIEARSFRDLHFHESCYDEATRICDRCGNRILVNEIWNYDSGTYCRDCFNAVTFECDECGNRFGIDDSNEIDNGNLLCNNCFDSDDSNEENCCHLKIHPVIHPEVAIAWKRSKKIRTFGIEIESNSDFDAPPFFTKVNDGSIQGKEYVSFVLPYNQTGFDVVKDFGTIARDNNARAGIDCGFHLHLGGYRNSYFNIKKVWLGYLIMENVFFSMMPKSRRNNNFCYRFTTDYTVESILRQNNLPKLLSHFYERQIKIKSSTPKDSYHSKRYYYVNLHVWLSRQTIEYRLHSGTINATKILMWTELNKRFTDWLTSSKTSINDVLSLAESEDKFYKIIGFRLKNHVTKRINKFGKTEFETITIR